MSGRRIITSQVYKMRRIVRLTAPEKQEYIDANDNGAENQSYGCTQVLRRHWTKGNDGPGPDGSTESTEPELWTYPHCHEFIFLQKMKGHVIHVTTRHCKHKHNIGIQELEEMTTNDKW